MTLSRFRRPAAPDAAAGGREIRLFQSETAEILETGEPNKALLAVFVLTGVFVGLLLIASCFRVDRVVGSTRGEIVTVAPTVVLGALDQSIIKTIEVSEGEKVARGAVLATLDPTFAAADVGALRAQLASLEAQIARCRAELARQPLAAAAGDDSYLAVQRAYYLQRQAQFAAQVKGYDDQIAQYQATIVKYQTDEARYGDRARISAEIERMRAALAAAQVGSRLNLLAATDQKLEVERALDFDRNAVLEARHELDAAAATRDAFVEQWYGQVSQELVTAQTSRDAAAEQLRKAARHQELVRLTAPEESVVLRIARLSPASVLNAGDPLIYLAPLGSAFEAELHVAARDIGFIRTGDAVSLKLDAYNFIEHGTVEGTLRTVSEGSFTTDDQTGQPAEPYYKARVALNTVTPRNVPPGFRLVPGITLKGDIHIGTRSLFTYLFAGVVRGTSEAMRNP